MLYQKRSRSRTWRDLPGQKAGPPHTPASPRLITPPLVPSPPTSSRSSVHAHTPGLTSPKSTFKHPTFHHFFSLSLKLYIKMQSRTVGKADVGRRCEQVGQTGRPKPAKSAKARFPAAGRFLPDAGPRPAPPDLLPIFALRDLDSKSAPGSASDAAVIPRTTS